MRTLNDEELKQVHGGGTTDSCEKGNNGFGNGGEDPAPGNSGYNPAPNAQEKLDDVVR